MSGLTHSILYDFYVKSIGASNLTDSRLKTFPLGVDNVFINQLFIRTLLLNCLNKYYAPLWEGNWQDAFKQDRWSKTDNRLKPFSTLTKEWK